MIETADLIDAAGTIVAAYVSNHKLPREELLTLVGVVANALSATREGASVAAAPGPAPRMPIRKTITPDALISLEDGKPYRTLKRHLSIRGLTPDAYRAKWGLPADYPMIAANYARLRSEISLKTGLGRKRPAPVAEPVVPAKRGRPRKSVVPG